MYLLDTNHCSALFKGNPRVVDRIRSLGDSHVATCAIVIGELVYGAHRSEHKGRNLRNIHEFRRAIDVFPIDDEIAAIYGTLKAAIHDHFGPKDKGKRRGFKFKEVGISENDLWIAACAKRNGLVVVSGDSDFDRIREVDDLMLEAWI